MGTGKENKKKKKEKKKSVLGYETVRILSLAVFLICLGIIGNKLYGYMADDDDMNNLMASIGIDMTTPKPPERSAPPYPEVTPERITYPQIVTTESIQELEEKYEDFVFWMYIEDTNINYYVVQADDNEFYLRKNIDKQTNGNGSLFMDYRNDPDNLYRHNIVYGHNQKNGTMFSDLGDYRDENFFNTHNMIYTYSGKGVDVWQIFSAYETTTDDYYIETWFESDDTYYDFIRGLQNKSLHSTDVVLTSSDVILSLSTCHKYENPNGRFVVHAVRIGTVPLA